MKIAIPGTRPDLDGMVAHKIGTAAHLLLIETDDMSYAATDGPPQSAGPGAGITAIATVVGMGAQVLLVDHIAPHIIPTLEKQGITVVTGCSGLIRNAVAAYLQSPQPEEALSEPLQDQWKEAARKGLRQFYTLLPKLIGVVLLLGLFRGLITEQALLSIFSGSFIKDSILGAAMGSILAGNPVNSYIIGEGLLKAGVSLAGVYALILSWVSVGLIQLPAEAAALSARFAITRNLASFIVAILMSITAFLLTGGNA